MYLCVIIHCTVKEKSKITALKNSWQLKLFFRKNSNNDEDENKEEINENGEAINPQLKIPGSDRESVTTGNGTAICSRQDSFRQAVYSL